MTFLKTKYRKNIIKNPIVKPILGLMKNIRSISGRNNTGKLVMFHRGGGLKKRYRIIDFKRILWNLSSVVSYNEYDPKRTSLISLICFYNGILTYIINTEGISSGDILFSGINYNYSLTGNCLIMSHIPEGNIIHSIELSLKKGAQMVRSAGVFAVLVKKFFKIKKILVRLPSKEEILVSDNFFAVLGQVSRVQHKLERLPKAGTMRKLGFRPIVRGVATNPIDHPHGGGGGKPQLNRWAKLAKGLSTRKILANKKSNFIIVQSRKKRRRK